MVPSLYRNILHGRKIPNGKHSCKTPKPSFMTVCEAAFAK